MSTDLLRFVVPYTASAIIVALYRHATWVAALSCVAVILLSWIMFDKERDA